MLHLSPLESRPNGVALGTFGGYECSRYVDQRTKAISLVFILLGHAAFGHLEAHGVTRQQSSLVAWEHNVLATDVRTSTRGRVGFLEGLMLRRLVTILFVFTLLGLCSAGRAKADDIFTWTLPTSPTIASGNVDLGGFAGFDIPGVSFSENGVPQSGVLDFFASVSGGGFDLGAASVCTSTGTCILDEGGAQLYTGTESAPTFVPGTYSMTGFPDSPNPGVTGTLTVTAGPNGDVFTFSTPEPASFLLMGAGVLSFLGFARKKILA